MLRCRCSCKIRFLLTVTTKNLSPLQNRIRAHVIYFLRNKIINLFYKDKDNESPINPEHQTIFLTGCIIRFQNVETVGK